ncbi:MAG TPA: hypothetical protein VMR76_02075 [Candidatus Saccharimonadia bacterium]|nr:hypothetical protein [Candidatus Saccharimonadia bacterium]
MYFGSELYGLESYIEHHGDGSNMYRTDEFGQPHTLRPGDVLATGLEIARFPFDAGNGGVGLRMDDSSERVVAARIPLQFLCDRPITLPAGLQVGNILETGCVVLSKPSRITEESEYFKRNRHEVQLNLTGGFNGHSIEVPEDLAIAILPELYPPEASSVIGKFTIENVFKMTAAARRNLPKLKVLGLEL